MNDRPAGSRSTPPARRRIAAVLACAAIGALAACSGRPVMSSLSGEPVCSDFEVGATHGKMIGGLQYPVRLTIKEGKTTLMKTMIVGKRDAKAPPTRLLLPDDDNDLTVEWAQCANERATRAVEQTEHDAKIAEKLGTPYECGDAKVYKTETLHTKKHDLKTHALTFPPPPNAQCWSSELPPPAPSASASASAAPDATAAASTEPAASASAAPATSASAGPAASASAGPAASASAGPAASAKTGPAKPSTTKTK